jgi:hypothetical protein
MSNLVAILLFCAIMLMLPAGRRVFLIFFGMIYVPFQMLFIYVQKVHLSLKDKDMLLFYLAFLVVVPFYIIVIPLSKLFEMFQESMNK